MKSLLLVALIPAVALAQKPSAGCSLLTAAEINGAVGAKVGAPHEVNMPVKRAGGKPATVTGCMWRVGEQGMVNISVLPASGSKEERDAGLAGLRQTYDMLKAQGWTVTESKLGDTLCQMAIPPKAESDSTPAMTGCFALSKSFVYSVSYVAPHAKVPAEKVKALADNVAKRLP